jgi:hypothetical protein
MKMTNENISHQRNVFARIKIKLMANVQKWHVEVFARIYWRH